MCSVYDDEVLIAGVALAGNQHRRRAYVLAGLIGKRMQDSGDRTVGSQNTQGHGGDDRERQN